MAPEQILGLGVDARTAVYALGVLLHQLLTGVYPLFSKDTIEQYRRHLEVAPPRPSSLAPLSTAIDAVVLKCLMKAPDARFPGTLELLEALRPAVGAAHDGARPRATTAVRSARGTALHLNVTASEAASDEVLGQIGDFLQAAEEAAAQAGLSAFLSTGSAVLAVRSLPDELEEAQAVLLHVDDVDIKLGASGVSVVGGALVNTTEWPISAERGWYLTRDVLALLAA